MLPSDLLAVSKRKGAIWPRYAKLSDDHLEVATALIEAYKRDVGEKKSILREFVGNLEDRGYEYRFVRGLSFLLDRRSVFKCICQVNPIDVRRRVYQTTRKFGLPATQEQRERIIDIVASEIKVDNGAVERFLYADLDSELVLEKFDPLLPEELLEQYNLSLTQTLLFDSTELNFTASGNWQRIFFAIKRFGLIYEASRNGRLWVKIDGPASLFKLTRRYGTAIAKLLPVIIANQEWTVEAKILWRYTNEICDFKIESWKHRTILRKPRASEVSYDSAIEEDFAAHFQSLKSGWRLRREPEPVSAGKQVIIPDFLIEKEGIKVYVEIVGFWTKEYLLRKIEKLKKVEVNMLVMVNEDLSCEKLAGLKKHSQLNIIYYHNKIPLAPILRYLEEALNEVKTTQKRLVKDLPIVFTEPVVNYEEFAARIGVSVEAVRTALEEKTPQDYVVLPNTLVKKEKLQEIEKRIDTQLSHTGRMQLTDALRLFEAEGVSDATSALQNLGYRIQWHGISAEKAEVLKPEKATTDSPTD